MLQISILKENKEKSIQALLKKNYKSAIEDIETILKLEEEKKKTQFDMDNSLSEANKIAKEIGELMKAGKKEEAESKKALTSELKIISKNLQEKFEILEKQVFDVLVKLPNLPYEAVPKGFGADDNEVIFEHGNQPVLNENALPHWDLIKKYDIIDFELGNKIAGAGFPVYKGKGAKLQRALINFFLDEASNAGYSEVQPPIFINKDSGFGTGQLPDKDGQMYYMNEDDLYAIPTAEVPITNMYRDIIIKRENLPIKHAGYSPCFRREAGSWGAHVRGLNRLHQFDKVEIVQITEPKDSETAHQSMVNHIKMLLEKLELPYRILKLCGGDMSFGAALCFDFEVYSAAQKRWLEVSSASNFDTFQANRLKCRFKNEDGKSVLVHTLNGSAMALPRIVAALLENNQTPEGIKLPKALVSYTGFEFIN
ncbi:MAG: serine--tRNA ligase [Cytophagales bacterium]|nr:MAG: serine--tRNA ligase [Cytophagales bacterium]